VVVHGWVYHLEDVSLVIWVEVGGRQLTNRELFEISTSLKVHLVMFPVKKSIASSSFIPIMSPYSYLCLSCQFRGVVVLSIYAYPYIQLLRRMRSRNIENRDGPSGQIVSLRAPDDKQSMSLDLMSGASVEEIQAS
jgi:hypothetical protein